MNQNIFKSTVHHLYHEHKTHKDKSRFDIFNKHKSYSKEDWYEHIRRNCDWGKPTGNINLDRFGNHVNESLLYVYKNSKKARITICMVNFLRYGILIKSLERLISFGIPLNIILWVNQSDSMNNNTRSKVEGLLRKFNDHDIIYSKKNMGTGYPRYMMFTKARYEYDTDYIMTMDDDIIHKNVDSFVMGATMLDQGDYSDYGASGVWCYPQYNIIKEEYGTMTKITPKEGVHDVDCLGAATMTIRREVLNTCNCDPQYKIGLVDWDFSMSMRQQGWKLCLLCDDRFKPVNDQSNNDDKYRNNRWDKSVIGESKKLFKKKWNIEIQ
jgi:hypothetical protein